MKLLPPYPAYRESSIEWIDDLPSHWEERRGKSLFLKLDRPVRPGSETVTCFRDGTVTLRRNRRTTGFTEAIQEIGYQGVKSGDLVIHAMDAFAGAVGVSDSDGKCSPVYSICGPLDNANPHYYARVVREMARNGYIQAQAKGIRERSTDFRFEGFGRALLPVPPPAEQRAIADFLDGMDARITRFIAARRKLIALLEEKKQAVINQAVTRGLDPSVPMKDSGVDWLGEIPEHWEVRRLKHTVRTIDQGVSPQSEAGLALEESWGVLKSGCVNGGVFRQTEHKRLPAHFVIDHRFKVNEGDVLVSRASGSRKFVGSSGLVEALDFNLILSDKTFRLNFKPGYLPRFFVRAMNSTYYREQVEQEISGAEGLANNLPLSSLREFYFSIPPKEEQESIVEYVDRESSRIDTLISRHRREIELMQEYRTRLISDVVTGKLDVRGVRLPAVEEVIGEEIEAAVDEEIDVFTEDLEEVEA